MATTHNLHQFAQSMRVLGNNVTDNSIKLVRKVGLAVDGTVVMATPVDTGRARSNWIVTIGAPASGARPAYSPAPKGSGAGGAANARAAIEQGKQVIATAELGQEIHITNNLSYIGALNRGYSAQAGANFVEKAVRDGVDTIKGATILVTDKTGSDTFRK